MFKPTLTSSSRDLAHLTTRISCLVLLATLQTSCMASSHATSDEKKEETSSMQPLSNAWFELASTPGRIEFETIESARWVVPREGLINLDHPRAREAGLEDGDEAISIFMHVMHHPDRGDFVIDSGVARSFEPGGEEPPVADFLKKRARLDKLEMLTSTATWLASREEPVRGIFLTHAHLDHVLGVPDFPAETALYAGPEETTHREMMHMFTRGTTNRLLEGKPPVQTMQFEADPAGIVEGVKDVFGDGEVFALHVPGHTPGSVAFLVRTTQGPVLVTGDAAHTAWGWEHCVESGTFNKDGAGSARSLKQLKALEERLPNLKVLLGHQHLKGKRSTQNACKG